MILKNAAIVVSKRYAAFHCAWAEMMLAVGKGWLMAACILLTFNYSALSNKVMDIESSSGYSTKNIYRKNVYRVRTIEDEYWNPSLQEILPTSTQQISAPYQKEEIPCPLSECPDDLNRKKWQRIIHIKQTILKVTGIVSPPNMTGFVLPSNPNLKKIIHEINLQNQPPKYTEQGLHDQPLKDDSEIQNTAFFIIASEGGKQFFILTAF